MANDSSTLGVTLAVVLGLFVFDHSDADWWAGETRTGYSIRLSDCDLKNHWCKATALPAVTYRIVREHNEVVWFTKDTGEIGRFSNCIIWDRKNWTCDDGFFQMHDGMRNQSRADNVGNVNHVWYQWELYKLGLRYPLPWS